MSRRQEEEQDGQPGRPEGKEDEGTYDVEVKRNGMMGAPRETNQKG